MMRCYLTYALWSTVFVVRASFHPVSMIRHRRFGTYELRVGKHESMTDDEHAIAMEKATKAMTAFTNKYLQNTCTKLCVKDLSWEPLRIDRVCEVKYDHLQGNRFRHAAIFLRWRADKQPADCRYGQLEVTTPYELKHVFGASGTTGTRA